MGNNIVMQFGGGCHGHPKGTLKGAIAIRQALDSTLQNISLKEYAKNHTELQEAIDKWGVKKKRTTRKKKKSKKKKQSKRKRRR